jgi:hypothetical protein
MNMQSGGWVHIVDKSGMRKLKCAASGEDDDAQYYQERYFGHDSIITGYGPIKMFEQVGASFPALVDILLDKFGIGPDLKEENVTRGFQKQRIMARQTACRSFCPEVMFVRTPLDTGAGRL